MKNKTMSMKKGKSLPTAGPSGKMVGKQSAGPQKPGVSATSTSGNGGKFIKGGSGKMAGKQTASPAKKA